MTANDYFLNNNHNFKKFVGKYQKTLLKLDLHFDLLSDRLTVTFTDKTYNRLYQIQGTRDKIIQKAKNIDVAFDLYCIPLLKKV
jgi:hypothetical protein